jgi:hypothetical protein
MTEVHVISKGPEGQKQYFDGEGNWTSERIDAEEYTNQTKAAEAILYYKLTEGDMVQEFAIPSLSLKPFG